MSGIGVETIRLCGVPLTHTPLPSVPTVWDSDERRNDTLGFLLEDL